MYCYFFYCYSSVPASCSEALKALKALKHKKPPFFKRALFSLLEEVFCSITPNIRWRDLRGLNLD